MFLLFHKPKYKQMDYIKHFKARFFNIKLYENKKSRFTALNNDIPYLKQQNQLNVFWNFLIFGSFIPVLRLW